MGSRRGPGGGLQGSPQEGSQRGPRGVPKRSQRGSQGVPDVPKTLTFPRVFPGFDPPISCLTLWEIPFPAQSIKIA